ncbi:MAG TPA: hypothetical protein VIM07_06245 [Chitinophagaceae bacterium]
MKNLLIAFALSLITVTSFAQAKHPNIRQRKVKAALAKYHDNIDNRMKGPNGEAIYIEPNGGRYYMKNGKKVYVEYKGNKN